MGVYRPQYRDKKTGEQKHTKTWYYEFLFRGRLIKESAKTTSKTVAKEAERERRRELEKGFNGLSDSRDDRIRTVREIAIRFLQEYQVRQPKSATFAEYALNHVSRLLGMLMIVDVTDKTVVSYQTSRLKESAAPKSINEEVGFLLRLLPIAQAGAIRAQLRQEKKLKLKITKRIGKAYSPEEKAELLKATQVDRRSKAIHLATMLALHAGLRDKEIRTLQWSRLDLKKRIVTVGQSKTPSGTGRTIPINNDLFLAAAEYEEWYKERFKNIEPGWYVFPFGKPRASDPTRPQTTFKTAWRKTREKARVQGRFHDNRHTFVTDLAESGAGDQVIQDLAGHVSKDMVKHYSHIRTEAKRRAVEALSLSKKDTAKKQQPESEKTGFSSVPQVSPQVSESE
jgi:integrase